MIYYILVFALYFLIGTLVAIVGYRYGFAKKDDPSFASASFFLWPLLLLMQFILCIVDTFLWIEKRITGWILDRVNRS